LNIQGNFNWLNYTAEGWELIIFGKYIEGLEDRPMQEEFEQNIMPLGKSTLPDNTQPDESYNDIAHPDFSEVSPQFIKNGFNVQTPGVNGVNTIFDESIIFKSEPKLQN